MAESQNLLSTFKHLVQPTHNKMTRMNASYIDKILWNPA